MILRLSLLALAATPAFAEATLEGRTVTLFTLTYEDPAKPLYVAEGETVIVGDGVEFGLLPEGVQNGLDVVPVRVNISKSRIEFDYAVTEPGWFTPAKFNGYVMRFDLDCTLFTGAAIDREFSTLPLAEDALSVRSNELMINTEGLTHDEGSHFAVDVEVMDCPLS